MDRDRRGRGGTPDHGNHGYRWDGGRQCYRHFLRAGNLLCSREMVDSGKEPASGILPAAPRQEIEHAANARIKHSDCRRLGSGFLSACKVGPKYHRPAVQTPNAFRDLSEIRSSRLKRRLMPTSLVAGFKDPNCKSSFARRLSRTTICSLHPNDAARAQLAITRSSLFPASAG